MRYRASSLSFKKEGSSRGEKLRQEVLETSDMKKVLKFVHMEDEKGAVISSLYRDMGNPVPVTLKEKG